MYRGQTTLPCPACGGTLSYGTSTLPVMGCGACGGMWLGPEAAVHLMRGAGDAVEKEIAASARTVARTSVAPPSIEESRRQCPVCVAPLSAIDLAGVRVDSCPAHGTFFDRKEIDVVVTKTRAFRDRAERKAKGHDLPTLSEFGDDARTIAIGMVTYPFRLIVDLVYAAVTETCPHCGQRVASVHDGLGNTIHHACPNRPSLF